MKYGRVSEYCEALGEIPLPQMHEKVRVVGSQVLASVSSLLAEVWEQISGQAEVCELHQESMLVSTHAWLVEHLFGQTHLWW